MQARLVLLGRTTLPPAEQWTHALEANGTPARVKKQIRKLIEIESLGAEALYLSCDVCRHEELKKAFEMAAAIWCNQRRDPRCGRDRGRSRPGQVAGRARGHEFWGRRSAEHSCSTMFSGRLCPAKPALRSTSCALFLCELRPGPAGQVDYAAANAFLDAFAASRHDTRVVAINWGPWSDVGMAARTSSPHPLLGRRLLDTADEIVYSVPLSYARHWVLAEHRLKRGRAVLPGTCYLEIALAALTHGSFGQGVEFEDVFFREPFFADPGQPREARVDLRRGSDGGFQFSVRARDDGWIEYASGKIALRKQPRPRTATSSASSLAVDRAILPSTTHGGPNKSGFSISAPGGGA